MSVTQTCSASLSLLALLRAALTFFFFFQHFYSFLSLAVCSAYVSFIYGVLYHIHSDSPLGDAHCSCGFLLSSLNCYCSREPQQQLLNKGALPAHASCIHFPNWSSSLLSLKVTDCLSPLVLASELFQAGRPGYS